MVDGPHTQGGAGRNGNNATGSALGFIVSHPVGVNGEKQQRLEETKGRGLSLSLLAVRGKLILATGWHFHKIDPVHPAHPCECLCSGLPGFPATPAGIALTPWLYTDPPPPDNVPLMLTGQDKVTFDINLTKRFSQTERATATSSAAQVFLPCPIICAVLLLFGLAGCQKQSPQAGTSPAVPTSQPAATQATQPVANMAAADYVLHPDIDPAEQTAGPKRIISTAPNLTELVWSLGMGGRQVGRTQYCLYPPQVSKVEIVGALLDPNIERILTLHPDLALITTSSTTLRERFEAVRLPVHALPDSSLEDIFKAIEQLGELTDRPRTAAKLVRDLRADLTRLQQAAKAQAGERPLKVVFVTGALPSPARNVWVAGPGGYLDTMLSMVGARNMAGEVASRPWMEITPEQIVWQQPDVIVEVPEAAQMPQRKEAAAAWRALPGLQSVRIVTLDNPAMLVPGPRVNVMLAKLVDGLYGCGAATNAD